MCECTICTWLIPNLHSEGDPGYKPGKEISEEVGTMEGVHHIVPTDTKVSEREGDNNVS